ncbi:MAG: hypothetical protein PHH47_13135 [Gallionella sp.]|nr:hypothetical protein [Gallionella sp.]MDD4947454.1 hypothetical protein [Gallionella sp.]
MTKTAWLFDERGILLSKIDVHPSPEEEGEFLIPERATTIEPPALLADEAAVFMGGIWVVLPDHRGKTIYAQTTGDALVVDAVGDIPAGYALAKPAVVVDAEATAARGAQIKADLAALDIQRIRPLAEGDVAYLSELNARAAALRADLHAL